MAPDRTVGLLHALPFVGIPLNHLLNLNPVARPGARGVRAQKRSRTMTYIRHLWLALIFGMLSAGLYEAQPVAKINSLDSYVRFTTFYYQAPNPDLVLQTIDFMQEARFPSEEAQFAPIIGFFSEVFASNKDKLPKWTERIKHTSGNTKEVLDLALTYAQDPERLLRYDPDNEKPAFNDICWGAFFASGKEVYLDAILKRLAFLSERTSMMRYVTAGSAQWSLASNARQHPLVKKYLGEALAKAQPEMRQAIKDTLERDPAVFQEGMITILKEQHEKKIW